MNMEKRKLTTCAVFFLLSLCMNAQGGLGYTLRFFPYNFYEWKEDVNYDYVVDTQDVLRIYEAIQNADVTNTASDVNSDNVVDTQDVLKVYQYIQTESSPTLISPDPAIDVISTAIELLDYGPIVRFPASNLSLIVPTDNGMLTYIDPVSMGQWETQIWKFKMNPRPTSSSRFSRIQAVVYRAEMQPDGSWLPTDSLRTMVGNSSTDMVFNRLRDILQNCIIAEEIRPDRHYYQTLSGNYVYVDSGDGNDLMISGGFQMDANHPSKVIKTADMLNGKAYVVDHAVYSSYNSVCDVLSANPDFSKFYEVLRECGAIATTTSMKLNWSSASKNGNLIYIPENYDESVYYLLNSYHYTMYVPTNEAMNEAFERGLPTMKMLNDAIAIDEDDNIEVYDSAAHLRKVMLDFVKYHIQENAVVIDHQYVLNRYASMKLNENYVPYKIQVEAYDNDLMVQGVCSDKQYVNKSKMYNKLVREYWLNNSRVESANSIETSSSVVLHAIDHPLLYNYNAGADLTKPENNQFIYVPREVYFESNY